MEAPCPLWDTPKAEDRLSTAASFLALELAMVAASFLFCGVYDPLSWVIMTYCGIAGWAGEMDQ